MNQHLQPSADLFVVRTLVDSDPLPILRQTATGAILKLELVDSFPEANVHVYKIVGEAAQRQRDRLKREVRALDDSRIDYIGTVQERRDNGAYQIYTGNLFIFLKASRAEEISSIIREHPLELKRKLGFSKGAFFLEYTASDARDIFSLCERLRSLPAVTHCEPELVVKRKTFKPQKTDTASRTAVENPLHTKEPLSATSLYESAKVATAPTVMGESWLARTVNLKAAHRISRGAGVTIAVIDDGLEEAHPAFAAKGKLAKSKDFLHGNPDAPGQHQFDEEMHGTACASIAVSSDRAAPGIAPEANLLVARVKGLGSVLESAAIMWAVEQGADIISCSWGPADGDPFSERDTPKVHPIPKHTELALEYAYKHGRDGKGCLIVFAAGNGNEPLEGDGYASNQYVIAAGSTNKFHRRSSYSDYGDPLFCCFPSSGIRVIAGVPRTESGYKTLDRLGVRGYSADDYFLNFGGTSAAAPGVAGVAALILSVAPHLKVEQLKQVLAKACTQPGNRDQQRTDQYGHGILNAYEAVRLAKSLVPASFNQKSSTTSSLLPSKRSLINSQSQPMSSLNLSQRVRAKSLHIGINNVDQSVYGTGAVSPLYGCIGDAHAWQEYAEENGYRTALLTDAQASRSRVRQHLLEMAEDLYAGDIALITYAGHGSQVEAPVGDEEEDGYDETWLLYDGIIIDDELEAIYAKFRPGVRVVVISDSCHSGSVTRNVSLQNGPADEHDPNGVHYRYVAPSVLRSNYKGLEGDYQRLKAEAAGHPDPAAYIILLPACTDNEVASEIRKRGAFSVELLELLQSQPKGLNYTKAMELLRSRLQRFNQQPKEYLSGTLDARFVNQFPLKIDGFVSSFGESPTLNQIAEEKVSVANSELGIHDRASAAEATFVVETAGSSVAKLATRGGATGRRVPSIGHVSRSVRGTETPWEVAYGMFETGVDDGVEFVEPNIESASNPFAFERISRSTTQWLSNHPNPDEEHNGPIPIWHLSDEHSQLQRACRVACPDVATGNIEGADKLAFPHVAHIDTGILHDHPSLPWNIDLVGARRFSLTGISSNVEDKDRFAYPHETQGHGAATIALLAGNYVSSEDAPDGVYQGFVGAFPQVRVTPLKISDSVVLLSGYNFARALIYAVDVLKVDVVTMSMAGAPSLKMARAIDYAYEKGVVVVSAGGNAWTQGVSKHLPKTLMFPARFDRVIAAVGVNYEHEPYRVNQHKRSAGGNYMESCYGPAKANSSVLAAYTPNTLWASDPNEGSGNLYSMTGGGTSTATPQIAAAAALWLHVHGERLDELITAFAKTKKAKPEQYAWMRAEACRAALFRSAQDKPAFKCEFGRGVLKANDALNWVPVANTREANDLPNGKTPIRIDEFIENTDTNEAEQQRKDTPEAQRLLRKASDSDLGKSAFDDAVKLLRNKRSTRSAEVNQVYKETLAKMLATEVWQLVINEESLAEFRDSPFQGDCMHTRKGLHLKPELQEALMDHPAASDTLKEMISLSSESPSADERADPRDLSTLHILANGDRPAAIVQTQRVTVETDSDASPPEHLVDGGNENLIRQFEFEITSESFRGANQQERIELSLPDEKEAIAALVVLTDEEGQEIVYWEPMVDIGRSGTRSVSGYNNGKLVIDLGEVTTRGNGKFFRKIFGKIKKVAVGVYKFVDNQVLNDYDFRVFTLNTQTGYFKDGNEKDLRRKKGEFAKGTRGEKGLLLLHGMFNTAAGTFSDLLGDLNGKGEKPNAHFAKLISDNYEKRVVVMDMPTIFKSFEHNADQLMKMPFSANRLDVIASSRGTQTARLFVQRLIDGASRKEMGNFELGRVVLSASPSFGTPLADKENMMELINRISNVMALAGKPLGPIIPTIMQIIKHLAKGVLSGKGLTQMKAGSDFLNDLNERYPFENQNGLFIGSNLIPTEQHSSRWRRFLDSQIVDKRIMGGIENDGVIPTQGTLGLRDGQTISSLVNPSNRMLIDPDFECGHFQYYAQDDVVKSLVKHLRAKSQDGGWGGGANPQHI